MNPNTGLGPLLQSPHHEPVGSNAAARSTTWGDASIALCASAAVMQVSAAVATRVATRRIEGLRLPLRP